MADLASLLINITLETIVLAPVLWYAGKKIARPRDVRFTDAVWIVVLGNVISFLIAYFSGGLVMGALASAAIGLLIWLLLVRHFFDTGWIRAIAISVVTVILFVIIGAVLAFLGLGVLFLL